MSCLGRSHDVFQPTQRDQPSPSEGEKVRNMSNLIISPLPAPCPPPPSSQLHAVPSLSGTRQRGGMASGLALLLHVSGSEPAAALPPTADQREQRGSQPHLLSCRVRRPGGALPQRGQRQLRGSLWPQLHVTGHRSLRPDDPPGPQEGRSGGPQGHHPGPPGPQEAQHTAGQKEAVGVSTLFSIIYIYVCIYVRSGCVF